MYTPPRLFGELGLSSDILNHEPFLERARLQREQDRDSSARLALGAYVVARLINKLLTMDASPDTRDGFRWQLDAVRRHLNDLPANAPETAHLAAIAGAVSAEAGITPGLGMNLTAYAYFLEHEGRLEESLETLSLAAQVQGSNTSPADFAVCALFAARLNRQLARWDTATTCYAAAEEAALVCGDNVSALRGRLGQGAVHRGRGNLPLAREIAERVARQAADLHLREPQALALADLGVVYSLQGLRLEALQAHYRAFQLTDDSEQRLRTLGDLALGLHEIGALEAARVALQIVVTGTASMLVRANAQLELMDVESASGNRIAFERSRTSAEEYLGSMSPSMLVDYNYKLGMGRARFGQPARARESLQTALGLAEAHSLNTWYFKIESALAALDAARELVPARSNSDLCSAPAVRQMEIGLREYALSAATA